MNEFSVHVFNGYNQLNTCTEIQYAWITWTSIYVYKNKYEVSIGIYRDWKLNMLKMTHGVENKVKNSTTSVLLLPRPNPNSTKLKSTRSNST